MQHNQTLPSFPQRLSEDFAGGTLFSHIWAGLMPLYNEDRNDFIVQGLREEKDGIQHAEPVKGIYSVDTWHDSNGRLLMVLKDFCNHCHLSQYIFPLRSGRFVRAVYCNNVLVPERTMFVDEPTTFEY
jgi:hypothetical protein